MLLLLSGRDSYQQLLDVGRAVEVAQAQPLASALSTQQGVYLLS